MSKKHFISLAGALRYQGLTNAQLNAIADWCQRENYRFNRARWLAYIAGECGPNGGPSKAAVAADYSRF